VVNTIAYWALAFPLAYVAAITYRLPPEYIWGGFVLGLSVAAILLTLRFRSVSRAALDLGTGELGDSAQVTSSTTAPCPARQDSRSVVD
jgi:MATE family multidrug resistance protein